jgi:NTP pyrophosphatase (non-canonical NTP hydrolase)
MDSKSEICRRAIDKYGAISQIHMAQGEAGELIAALCRYQIQQRGSSQDVIEEIADVSIMIHQLKQIFGENRCEQTEIKKLKRLAGRIDE